VLVALLDGLLAGGHRFEVDVPAPLAPLAAAVT
jgi:hypothetical protein